MLTTSQQLTTTHDEAYDLYMSDGFCSNACVGSAFAIVQDFNCWCSNYIPGGSTQSDTSDCNTSCPGFPDDTCGGDNLYGYIALGQKPSGTQGGVTSTTKATSTTKVSVQRFALLFLLLSSPSTHPRHGVSSNLPGLVHASRCGLVAKYLPPHL